MQAESAVATRDPVVGLSIDDGVLRAVIVEPGASPTVLDAVEADLAAGIVREGRVLDQGALAQRIGELWRAVDLGGLATVVGMHPVDSLVQTLVVQRWPSIGWPPEVLDLVAELRGAQGREPVWTADRLGAADVIVARLVACGREDLSSATWAARRSGVWVAGVELSGLALARAVRPMGGAYEMLIDATGPAQGTLVLLDHGLAVRAWRVPLGAVAGATGGLWSLPLDGDQAWELAQLTRLDASHVPDLSWSQAQPALLVGPGSGLADTSPVPSGSLAIAFGLALGAIGVGDRPLDLQASLLTTGVASLQAQIAGRIEPAPGAPLPTASSSGPLGGVGVPPVLGAS